ncbi:MAG: 4Fe-4S binding protein [Candidatus Hermodarchaeota archaeon]
MSEQDVIPESQVEVYKELQQLLHTLPVGYPATKSGVELRLLKRVFTPEEAKIATHLTFSYDNLDSLDTIYGRMKGLGYTKEELKSYLDNMVKKGAIQARREGNNRFYSLAMFMIGTFEFQVNRLTKDYVKDLHQYMMEGFMMEAGSTQIGQLRVVPVEESVTPSLNIANYEDLSTILENAKGPFVSINCVCRQGMELIGNPCKNTARMDVCMGIGDFAQMYLDEGWGKEISRDQALEILRKNQEEGMIIQPGNAKKPDFICSCCTCCCEGLQRIKMLPNPADFVTSNYFAVVDSDLCTTCETCIDVCQMDAIKITDETSEVNKQRCIGCGNCVVKCPSEALSLQKKEEEYIPPETEADLYNTIWDRKKVLLERDRKRQLRKEKQMQK